MPRTMSGSIIRCYRLANASLYRLRNGISESVNLVERRVDVRRDPDPVELPMRNRSVHDPVLLHQPRAELVVRQPINVEKPESTRLLCVERRQHMHPRTLSEQ